MTFFPVSFLEAKNTEELKQLLLFLRFYHTEMIKKEKEPIINIFVCLQDKDRKIISLSLNDGLSLIATIGRIIILYKESKETNINSYIRIHFKGWEYVLN